MASKRSARENSGGSLRDVVGGADDEGVALVVVQPGQQRAEEPGRDARVAGAPPRSRPGPSRPRRSSRRRATWRRPASGPGGRWPPTARPGSRAASRRRGPASAAPSRRRGPWRTRSCPSPAAPAGARRGRGPPRAGPGRRAPRAERLERPQAAQAGEASRRRGAGSAGRTSCSAPALISQRTSGGEPAVADQRQAEGVLGLQPRQPRRRVEHGGQAVALGQLARLGGDAAGDRLELVAAGQVVLDDDEELLQLDGDLDDRGEDDDEGAVALAGLELGVEGLGDLGRSRGSGGSCGAPGSRCRRAWPGPAASGRRPAGRRRRGARPVGAAGDVQAAVDVPGGQGPALVAAQAGDLGDGVVVLVGADVDAGERGAARTPKSARRASWWGLLGCWGWAERGVAGGPDGRAGRSHGGVGCRARGVGGPPRSWRIEPAERLRAIATGRDARVAPGSVRARRWVSDPWGYHCDWRRAWSVGWAW